MSSLLSNFMCWFSFFGLSFLVEYLGWTEQGKAFSYIYIGFSAILGLAVIIISIIQYLADNSNSENSAHYIVSSLYGLGILLIFLLAAWGATKLFNVDFYAVFQIMTFGQCLSLDYKKKD